ADKEIDLIAFDQLAGLLHSSACVTARRVFREQFDLTAENAALSVDLLDRKLTSDFLILARRSVCAGQRVIETDFDVVCGTRADHEGRSNLQHTCGGGGFQNCAP